MIDKCDIIPVMLDRESYINRRTAIRTIAASAASFLAGILTGESIRAAEKTEKQSSDQTQEIRLAVAVGKVGFRQGVDTERLLYIALGQEPLSDGIYRQFFETGVANALDGMDILSPTFWVQPQTTSPSPSPSASPTAYPSSSPTPIPTPIPTQKVRPRRTPVIG